MHDFGLFQFDSTELLANANHVRAEVIVAVAVDFCCCCFLFGVAAVVVGAVGCQGFRVWIVWGFRRTELQGFERSEEVFRVVP